MSQQALRTCTHAYGTREGVLKGLNRFCGLKLSARTILQHLCVVFIGKETPVPERSSIEEKSPVYILSRNPRTLQLNTARTKVSPKDFQFVKNEDNRIVQNCVRELLY